MKGNVPSKLRPQVLDRHLHDIKGNEIATELNCSTAMVSQYITEFETKVKTIEAKRKICKERQNSFDISIRLLCLKHASCKTCDVGLKQPKPIRKTKQI